MWSLTCRELNTCKLFLVFIEENRIELKFTHVVTTKMCIYSTMLACPFAFIHIAIVRYNACFNKVIVARRCCCAEGMHWVDVV